MPRRENPWLFSSKTVRSLLAFCSAPPAFDSRANISVALLREKLVYLSTYGPV